MNINDLKMKQIIFVAIHFLYIGDMCFTTISVGSPSCDPGYVCDDTLEYGNDGGAAGNGVGKCKCPFPKFACLPRVAYEPVKFKFDVGGGGGTGNVVDKGPTKGLNRNVDEKKEFEDGTNLRKK